MSAAQLRVSLALWQRRESYRRKALARARRAAKSGKGAQHAGVVTKAEAARIHKWERLLREAEHMVARRRKQLDALRPNYRAKIVAAARLAAANYRRNPGAYHYLAGGVANTVIMRPTPRNWRSDCSQFAAGCYKAAGAPCPGGGDHAYASTYTMIRTGHRTYNPKPGDLGFYGSRWAPHHVEVVVPGGFIGHGSPPIDSLTPGRPDFYWTYDWLD